jgi:hypothetical protein
MNNIRGRAIAYAEEHRDIHIAWITWWQNHPPKTPAEHDLKRAVGGIETQRKSVHHYDVILRALREK